MNQFYTRAPEKFPPAVRTIIIINVAVWLLQMAAPNLWGYDLTARIGLWPVGLGFQPWQLITHMFAHADSGPYQYIHILFNMFTLWMFGRILENVWGSKRFTIFYLLCGLGAAGLHLLMQYFLGNGVADMAVGASGAVFGVLVAFAMTFPNTELYLMFIPVPIKAKWAILGLVAIDLFGGIYQVSGDSIAHYAHLGGAITGFILLKFRNKTNRRTLY